MKMSLDRKKASSIINKSMRLDNVIVTPVKQKTSADLAKEKKAKKAPAARKKKA